MLKRRPWQEELDIIDRTMKAISSISDPEELVDAYFEGIGDLLPIHDYVSVSRRNEPPPFYRVTRSSRFTEHHNPWTHRELLPILSGGLLGEIAFANKPIIIDDLPSRLNDDDPGRFYLERFQSLVSLPQYDGGEALNVTAMLLPEGLELDRAVIPMLYWQSGLFGRGTQNLVLRNQLAKALESLDAELKVVGNIQRSLLPRELPEIPGFELAAHYQTSARAGGDYYDFFELDGGKWGLFIADVSGHGTPAAVIMAITHALAHARPSSHTPPCELLKRLNEDLTRLYTRGETFVTAFYAVLDPAQRTLSYSSAGHNPPRLIRNGNAISLSENASVPLGILDDETYRQGTISLERGDLILLYTDGITETPAPPRAGEDGRDLFGVERLDQLLLDCRDDNPPDCLSKVRAAVTSFGNAPMPTDDQTLIAIRCL